MPILTTVGIGLLGSLMGVLLFAIAISHPPSLRRAPSRRTAVPAAPAQSAIEDLVATKSRIRQEEAAQWLVAWCRITGQRDQWELNREIRDLAFAAQQREWKLRDDEWAAKRAEERTAHDAKVAAARTARETRQAAA